jgi:hypothetical protein
MRTSAPPLFDPSLHLDPSTLTGALFLHSRALEECLLATGHLPGVGYTAFELLKIAATLVAAPESRNGFPRYLLPPERVPEHAYRAVPPEDDIPF